MTRLHDALDRRVNDGQTGFVAPSNRPVVTATEVTNESGQLLLKVRCPFCGHHHHHGRVALPAWVHATCSRGFYTIEAVA